MYQEKRERTNEPFRDDLTRESDGERGGGCGSKQGDGEEVSESYRELVSDSSGRRNVRRTISNVSLNQIESTE